MRFLKKELTFAATKSFLYVLIHPLSVFVVIDIFI